MESNRKPYTREFKTEVVNMITGGGASAAQVANDMDIPLKTLYQWIQELTAKPEEVFPGKGQVTSDAEIIRKLRRENERLKMECEILRKAKGISEKDEG
jgi:transposase